MCGWINFITAQTTQYIKFHLKQHFLICGKFTPGGKFLVLGGKWTTNPYTLLVSVTLCFVIWHLLALRFVIFIGNILIS